MQKSLELYWSQLTNIGGDIIPGEAYLCWNQEWLENSCWVFANLILEINTQVKTISEGVHFTVEPTEMSKYVRRFGQICSLKYKAL